MPTTPAPTITLQRRYADRPRDTHLIFVDNTPDPDMPRPPHTVKGDDPKVDKAWRRYNRMQIQIMRDAAARATGFDPKDLRFSRRAGCSMCPCSPGFIVPATTVNDVTFFPGHATWVDAHHSCNVPAIDIQPGDSIRHYGVVQSVEVTGAQVRITLIADNDGGTEQRTFDANRTLQVEPS